VPHGSCSNQSPRLLGFGSAAKDVCQPRGGLIKLRTKTQTCENHNTLVTSPPPSIVRC